MFLSRVLMSATALSTALLASSALAIDWSKVTNKDATAGLRETLAQGAKFAVDSLGKEDGFLGNEKVRLPLPAGLQKVQGALKPFGMEKEFKKLEETLNRSAEKAVATATPILTASIKKMSVNDAKNILSGGDHSVTDYFRRSTSAELTQKFLPIVKENTSKLKLADQFQKAAGKGVSMGLLKPEDADLDSYVANKAMDGLFVMIAEKEKAIRDNPLEAGSKIINKVFSALGK